MKLCKHVHDPSGTRLTIYIASEGTIHSVVGGCLALRLQCVENPEPVKQKNSSIIDS